MPLAVIGALWGIQYIATLTGESKVEASGAVSMLYVGWLVGGPFAGWLSDRIGHRRLLLVGSTGLTLLSTVLLLLFSSMAMWQVYALMFAIGLSSCPQVVSFVVAVEHNRRDVSGTAIAATNMIVMFLGGLGMALFGVLLDWASGPGPLDPAANYPVFAYRVAMALLPACALFGACAALILRESINNEKPDPAEPVG
jgi:MFS family permease